MTHDEAKHTSGPWIENTGEKYEDGTPTPIRVDAPMDSTPGPVCNLYTNFSREQNEANAHLIAAAPELLEVCKALLEASQEPAIGPALCEAYIEGIMELTPQLQSAIAKAKGNGMPNENNG